MGRPDSSVGLMPMADGARRAFDRPALIAAFETIGEAASRHDVRLDIAVYGGSALMLVSNFCFATEDVDIARLDEPRPEWLVDVLATIGRSNGWADDWINDAVSVHLSPLATRAADHLEFASFPSGQARTRLCVFVPTAEYLLALKLKAMRLLDPAKGRQEADDIRGLMGVLRIGTADEAIAILAKFFPNSAIDFGRQRFFLKLLGLGGGNGERDAPRYA